MGSNKPPHHTHKLLPSSPLRAPYPSPPLTRFLFKSRKFCLLSLMTPCPCRASPSATPSFQPAQPHGYQPVTPLTFIRNRQDHSRHGATMHTPSGIDVVSGRDRRPVLQTLPPTPSNAAFPLILVSFRALPQPNRLPLPASNLSPLSPQHIHVLVSHYSVHSLGAARIRSAHWQARTDKLPGKD
jgi:hypothetical protein